MFGSKFRSWMEAVRPRKKQQRKDKQKSNSKMVTNIKTVKSYCSSENEILEDVVDRKSMQTISSHAPRYSGANLSSPESAYSTGYSTDGTSPGAPPEYYINIRTGTRYFPSVTPENDDRPSTQIAHVSPNLKEDSRVVTPARTKLSPRHNLSPRIDRLSTVAVRLNGECATVSMTQDYEGSKNSQARASVTLHNNLNSSTNGVVPRLTEVVVNSGITSPRQRNRIRTNPWLPGNNLSPGSSSIGLHNMRTDHGKSSAMNSPVPSHYLSPTVPCSPINKSTPRYESSSSSCSSLSASSLHWDSNLVRQIPEANSASDEDDDCTLNEMMGKYDESYVYEKETDILSDSDPTDCETDIDTGQDGGDEDDPLEREFDFIDNGSFLDFNIKDERNTGHCTYYNFEIQRKCSRRRTTSKRTHKQEGQNQIVSKQASDRRRRSNCSKKRQRYEGVVNMQPCAQSNGSKSAGATPLSVRRTKHPLSKVALEDRLKKRSNSISFCRDPVSTFDQRDKEADKKYKELIVEAEHILMSMKQGALSPRRLPGPANKRVELLRTESVKPDSFIKNRLIEDISNMHLSRIPSNVLNSSSRCSPKKNHITNFINNNSPILMRRESERSTSLDVKSPLGIRKEQNANFSPVARKKHHGKTDSRRSPKYRKKISKASIIDKRDSSTSDSECERKPKQKILSRNNSETNGFSCPQSEPVKRKVYNHQTKTVAFNLNYESVCNLETNSKNNFESEERANGNGSVENLRQQVLLNTIANLKKSLENQSASLKQVYNSSQNVHF